MGETPYAVAFADALATQEKATVSALVPISIKDSSGGLNLRDSRSALKADQLALLKNYLTDEAAWLTKRKGQKLLQFAPIDPSVYTVDANTLIHYTFDEATRGADIVNDGSLGAGYNLSANGDPNLNGAPSAKALFPIGAGLGRLSLIADNSGTQDGTAFGVALGSSPFDNLAAFTVRGWAKLGTAFNGAPITLTRGATTYPAFSNSGVPLFGTVLQNATTGGAGGICNGFTLHRDYDTILNVDTSDQYVKFTLRTKGIPGTVTVLTSRGLPTGVMLEFKVTYDSVTGILSLFVNGTLHDQAAVLGGGLVDDSLAYRLMAFGADEQFVYANSVFKTAFGTILDEWEISSVVRAGFNFKKPRGRGVVLQKSDGTNQLVAAAEEGLYYTILNDAWVKITSTDPATNQPLSSTDDWDMVQIGDRLYMTNGVNTPLTWNGTAVMPTGEGVTPLTLTPSAAGSTSTNGSHSYVYTYMYGDDETGFSPAATWVVAGNLDVNIQDIPTRDVNCSAIRLYKTKAGGTQYFLFREIPNDPTVPSLSLSGLYASNGSPDTDTGADGIPDGSTSTNLNDDADFPEASATVVFTRIPKARYYLGEHNRLMGAGMTDRRYDLVISALGNPDVFRSRTFAQVPTNNGPIVAIYSYYGEVHISLNAKATNVLSGKDESDWTLTTNLNPKVGARDHWAVEHRYPIGDAGPYIIVFAGTDGEYHYAGQKIEKISDLVNPLYDSFSLANSSLEAWLTTQQSDWQSAKSMGGSTTLNMQADRYETDGLRQTPASAEIVNMLDYIALWKQGASPVVGNVIFKCKGVAEGEFFFSTDANNNLYHTFDNFQTATVLVTVGAVGERIIEIVRRGTDDFYFLFTDTAHATAGNLSSAGGYVYAWDNGSLALNVLYNTARLYSNLDVPVRMAGGSDGIGEHPGAPNNMFLNHPQRVFLVGTSPTNWNIKADQAASVSVPGTTEVFSTGAFFGPPGFPINTVTSTLDPNFLTWRNTNVGGFQIDYTRREFPLWRGGTFRPQAYWDAAHTRLVFVGATPDDANGNSASYLRTLSDAGVLTNQYTAQGVSTFAVIGANILFYSLAEFVAGFTTGFVGRIQGSTLASPSVITGSAAYQPNLLLLRMSFNSQNATAYLASSKSFNTGVQNFWTYTGGLNRIPTATSVPSSILDQTADGDSGPVIPELAVQTTTPYAWYAAVDKITNAAVYKVDVAAAVAADVSVYKDTPYAGDTASAAVTGIISNLLFVPQSAAAGGYLWSDRLYWMAKAASAADARLLQLGVPGTWEVRAEFVSKANNLGTFNSFGAFSADFGGAVAYFFRNATIAAGLAASEVPQTANQAINAFAAPQPWAQFRAVLTWAYSVAVPTSTPSIRSVLVEFFLGVSNVPRPVGIHWMGRTYFAFATNGALENDTVLVYDKKNAFTVYEGWFIEGFTVFKNMLTAFQGYDLVQCETGTTDMGARIDGEAWLPTLAQENMFALQEVEANLEGSNNRFFPDANGNLEIVPMAGDDELPGLWTVPIHPSTSREIQRAHGVPVGDFQWSWGQAFSVRIRTSQQAMSTGVAALTDQQEVIQQLDLKLVSANAGRNYTGK